MKNKVVVYDTLVKFPDFERRPVPLFAVRIADITNSCPDAGKFQAVLRFAHDAGGPLVQISNMCEREEIEHITFFYEEMGKKGLTKNTFFAEWANNWGLGAAQLAEIIFKHAPID